MTIALEKITWKMMALAKNDSEEHTSRHDERFKSASVLRFLLTMFFWIISHFSISSFIVQGILIFDSLNSMNIVHFQ